MLLWVRLCWTGKPSLPNKKADFVQATECLESISKQQGNDSNLLYACVLEAQKNGDRLQVIRALTQVLEKTSYQAIAGLHLPALLRCVANDSSRCGICVLTTVA